MSVEGELLRLAREREASTDDLARLDGQPSDLGRQLRSYLSLQVDRGWVKRTDERVVQYESLPEGRVKLSCNGLDFESGARLKFTVQLVDERHFWLLRQFEFDVIHARSHVLSIHLNPEASRKSLDVPRCHFHIGEGEVHLPFPIMHPLLILHVICKYIAPSLEI